MKSQHEGQVVARRQPEEEQLIGAQQVRQVGATEGATGAAGAAFLERLGVVEEARVAQVQAALGHPQVPLRAMRAGSTESNMSMPASTASSRSTGEPRPIR